MPQDNKALVKAAQADRDAAAVLASRLQRYTLIQIEAPAMRSGKHDDWEFVQTFARHRIEAQASSQARIEALEAEIERLREALKGTASRAHAVLSRTPTETPND